MIGTSTKKLFLMRHAKSDWADPSLSDSDRPLNARGRASAPLMAQWMQSHQSVPDVVLCSTALRTRQTLELLTENWSSGSTEIHFLDELYLAPAASLLSIASKHTERSTLLVLGHNPGMSDLASYLAQSEVDMPTGAIATLESNTRNWPEDWFQASSWNWRGLVKPRDLGNGII